MGLNRGSLNGRGYARFLAAGAYFLRKYRAVVNDLNVYPVPDGDTGTNMYLTARSASLEAYARRSTSLSEVAEAAAKGALMGARGNSGVILSQMLRGFAHHVRHRSEIDTFTLATAMREAALAARQALLKPAEGTILSIADAAAESAYRLALHESDLYRFLGGILKAANEALEATPRQLPALAEAGVVDAGGAGFVYLLEGALAFLPEVRVRATAFPRRPDRALVFHQRQVVGEHRYCTEFVLEGARCSVPELRAALETRGESVVVAGAPPTIRVHVHTDDPSRIESIAARYGSPTRMKVDDMQHQHRLLLVDRRTRSIVAVVPGPGFEAIARELGAEVILDTAAQIPGIDDFLLAINKCLGSRIFVLADDASVVPAAREAALLSGKDVTVVPTRNPIEGIADLLAMRSIEEPSEAQLEAAIARTRSAQIVSAEGESLSEIAHRAVEAMRDGHKGGLITLYYGGSQHEKDARRLGEGLQAAFTGADVEYYYGGMKNAEYWIAFDE
jgi:DAK2 domain fusion protein YloV